MRRLNLGGRRFGSLTAIEPTAERKGGQVVWRLECDCGTHVYRPPSNLKRSRHQSCGCKTKEIIQQTHIKHGMSKRGIYRVWSDMKTRCMNPNSTAYRFYGGRGISVCPRWAGADGFEHFLTDMGPKPFSTATLDRKDPDGNYEPGNCHWLTKRRQPRNTRATWRAPCGTPVLDLAEAAGLPISTVSQRVNKLGWSLERALSTPKKHDGVRPMPERPHSRVNTGKSKTINGLLD